MAVFCRIMRQGMRGKTLCCEHLLGHAAPANVRSRMPCTIMSCVVTLHVFERQDVTQRPWRLQRCQRNAKSGAIQIANCPAQRKRSFKDDIGGVIWAFLSCCTRPLGLTALSNERGRMPRSSILSSGEASPDDHRFATRQDAKARR